MSQTTYGEGPNGYIAILERRQIEIKARTLFEARTIAEAVLKPTKRNRNLLHVELVELGGEQVTTTITN